MTSKMQTMLWNHLVSMLCNLMRESTPRLRKDIVNLVVLSCYELTSLPTKKVYHSKSLPYSYKMYVPIIDPELESEVSFKAN